MKKLPFYFLLLLALLACTKTQAQFTSGLSELSIAISDNQYGMPFLRLGPLHPGIELAATFWENDKPTSSQKVSAHLGYLHHGLLVAAPYVKASYTYQLKIKGSIGLDAQAGFGYFHGFYPGDGYQLNDATGEYEAKLVHQPFSLSTLGLGISYIKPQKINPFVRYEMKLAGFSFNQLISCLHVGVMLNLNKKETK